MRDVFFLLGLVAGRLAKLNQNSRMDTLGTLNVTWMAVGTRETGQSILEMVNL